MMSDVLFYSPFVDSHTSKEALNAYRLKYGDNGVPAMQFPYGTSVNDASIYANQHQSALVLPTIGPVPSEEADRVLRALSNTRVRFFVLDQPGLCHMTADAFFMHGEPGPVYELTHPPEERVVSKAPQGGRGRKSTMDAEAVMEGLERAKAEGCAKLSEIAESLNRSGVATPSGQGTWDSAKITRVANKLGVEPWWTTRNRKR